MYRPSEGMKKSGGWGCRKESYTVGKGFCNLERKVVLLEGG